MPHDTSQNHDDGHGAAGILWEELNKPPVFLKLRSSKGLIGVTAFVAAFIVRIGLAPADVTLRLT